MYAGIANQTNIESTKKLFKDIEVQASAKSPDAPLITPSSQPSHTSGAFGGNQQISQSIYSNVANKRTALAPMRQQQLPSPLDFHTDNHIVPQTALLKDGRNSLPAADGLTASPRNHAAPSAAKSKNLRNLNTDIIEVTNSSRNIASSGASAGPALTVASFGQVQGSGGVGPASSTISDHLKNRKIVVTGCQNTVGSGSVTTNRQKQE